VLRDYLISKYITYTGAKLQVAGVSYLSKSGLVILTSNML